jgi:uncharacterized protein
MKCPVCGEPDLHIAERQGIEVDYCVKCRGVWLDRGELDKLLARAGYESAEEEYEDRGRRGTVWSREDSFSGGEEYRRPPRRKSLLREILDFD